MLSISTSPKKFVQNKVSRAKQNMSKENRNLHRATPYQFHHLKRSSACYGCDATSTAGSSTDAHASSDEPRA